MEIINKTKFLEFKSTKSPSGNDWYYVRRTNDTNEHDSAVAITTLVKINDEYNFLFLKTNRPPLSAEKKAKYCLESPAGLIGDVDCYENLIECTKKELLEETGLSADKIFIELKNCCTSAGLSSETLSFVTAIVENNSIKSEPISDGGIIMDRLFIPISKINSFLNELDKKEYSIAAATICGIYYALNRVNSL